MAVEEKNRGSKIRQPFKDFELKWISSISRTILRFQRVRIQRKSGGS